MTAEFPPGYRVIGADEAEERFNVSRDIWYPYRSFADQQEIRLYEGGLTVAGGVESCPTEDWSPYNIIVDGDLELDGELDLYEESNGHFVVVTGDLRARSVLLVGCPNLVVRGNLTVTDGVLGRRGDDGGLLVVSGQTRAPFVMNLLYFNMEFGSQPEAVVCGDPYRMNCTIDFEYDDEFAAAVLPEVLGDEGTADDAKIYSALLDGRAVFRPGAQPPHIAAQKELDALLERADTVTELDLSGRRLRAFPETVLRFPNLRRLSLAGNDDLGTLPKTIATLTALEELDVSDTGLAKLPKAIGALKRLRTLDISGNDFAKLPDSLGDLTELRVLRADGLRCAVPDTLAQLANLEGLSLSRYGHRADKPLPFPVVVTRLPRLRSLDLTMSVLHELPDDLLQLSTLEELYLDAALGLVERLPDLAKLPRLTTLRMDGRSGNSGRYPKRELLTGVWDITTLEDLGLDRWGKQKGRPGLQLPADAFERLPNLKRINLSFNNIGWLPDPFYRLEHLEFVDLQYTKLNSETLDRIAATFPRVKMDLRNIEARSDVDDPEFQEINRMVKRGGQLAAQHDYENSVEVLREALARCVAGARYSEYDRLYALYSIVDSLGRLAVTAEGERFTELSDELIEHAGTALAEMPAMIWHYTDFGAFQEEVIRRCGNALAWHLMERGELDRALSTVERAVGAAQGADHDYVRDTHVRILLRLGRDDDAYLIVDKVLARNPDFEDFVDLREAHRQWRTSAERGVA